MSDIDFVRYGDAYKKSVQEFMNVADGLKKDVILVFSDIFGSSRQSVEDPQGFFRTCVHHFYRAQKVLAQEGFSVVKTIGDEVMLSFTAVDRQKIPAVLVSVLKNAFSFQSELHEAKIETKIAIHVCEGVYPSEVIEKLKEGEGGGLKDLVAHPGDVFGTDVNLAARVMSIAQKGQLVLSRKAFENLPSEWQQAAREGSQVGDICFDLPMSFPFKGFEKSPGNRHVIQVFQKDSDLPLLSESGYNFRTFTEIDLKNDDFDTVSSVEAAIYKIFPVRSIICSFKRERIGGIIGNRRYKRPELSVLFQCYNFEHYTDLLKELKEGQRENISSTLTYPIWPPDNQAILSVVKELDGAQRLFGYLTLWKCPAYGKSEELSPELGKIASALCNLMLMGYFDNLAVVKASSVNTLKSVRERIDTRRPKLGDKEIIDANATVGWPIEICRNRNFRQWSFS